MDRSGESGDRSLHGWHEPLRLLLLEDDDDDARLIAEAVERSMPSISVTRAATRAQFIDDLAGGSFDVALLENDVFGLDGRTALTMLRTRCPEVPVIMVTRPLGEPTAVELLKLGARDYVLKDDLGHLAVAVQRAVSIEAGIRDRKATERETSRSERRYRRLFESATDGIVLVDAESGQVTDVNPRICTLLEHAREDLVGKELWETGVLLDRAAWQQMVRRLGADGRVRYEDLPLRTSSSAIREVELVSTVYTEAEATVIQCNIRDISAQRRLERRAAESDRRLRSMLDDVDLVAVQLDLDRKVTYVNDFFLELVDHQRDEVIGSDWFELFIAPEDRDETVAVMASVHADQGGPGRHHENEILTRSGERRMIRWSNTVLRDDGGAAIGSAAVGEDLTEQRRTIQTLAETEGRFRALVDNSSDVLAIVGPDGQVRFVSQAVRALGFEPEEVVGTSFTGWVHPTDLDAAARTLAEVLEIVDGSKHTEVRIRHENGSWSDMDVVAVNKMGVLGIDGIALFLRDMTKRNQAERELYSSRQLLAGILDSLPVRVFWKDTDLVYLGCNTAFAIDAGFADPTEVIGKRDDEMGWHDQADLYRADDRRVMESGEPALLYEEPQTTPDGGTITLLTSKVPLRDLDGEVSGILGTYLDITEKVRQQTAIERGLDATVAALARMVEQRDRYTAGHQVRVADLAVHIARTIGMDPERIRGLHMAATIHDLGQISIPAEILTRPGPLTDAEYVLVQEHPESGYQMVREIDFPWPVGDMIRQHHERLDGSGYPQGLTGDDILLEARIMAVADTVEAFCTHRPYRPALGSDAALDAIIEGRGITFDAEVVDTCVNLFRDEHYTFPDP